MEKEEVMKEVAQMGGFVGYVHTEKDHDWGNPTYQAMEIYNIHTDLLDEPGLLPFIMNNAINGCCRGHWILKYDFPF